MAVLNTDNRGGALWVTMNRPEAYNSLSPEVICGILDAWEQAENDDDIRVVVLTGAGSKAFCSGADLKLTIPLLTGVRAPADAFDRRLLENRDDLSRLCLRDRTFCKPIICAINGAAMGGGFELMLASDIRIASSSATFALPEPKVGLVPGAGSMVRLPRQLPWCRAMEILLTGEPIDAAKAKEYGLINRVVAAEDLVTETEKLAARLLTNAPLSLQAIKRTAVMTSGMDLESAFSIEDLQTAGVMASEDAKEGPRAFAEKRQPLFQSR